MKMDRDTLNEAIQGGPIRVTMNSGQTYEIPSRDHAIVDSIAAHVLTKDADGKFRTRILALVCMVSIEKLAAAA
jgi:hypothetical protein